MASKSWGRQTQSSSTEQAFIACLNLQAMRISIEGHNNFFYGFCSYPPPPHRQLANIQAKSLSALHCKQNLIFIFPEMKLRGLVPNFHMHVSVSDLCILSIGPPILLQQNRRADRGNI
jgi:hypothetical protein